MVIFSLADFPAVAVGTKKSWALGKEGRSSHISPNRSVFSTTVICLGVRVACRFFMSQTEIQKLSKPTRLPSGKLVASHSG